MTLIVFILFNLTVEEIHFYGNKNFSTKLLKTLLPYKKKEELNEELLSLSEKKLKEFYFEEGFIFAEINTQIETTASGIVVKYFIKENNRPKIKEINFHGIAQEEITKLLSPLKFYEPKKLEAEKNRLLKELKESGYYYSTVTYDTSLINNQLSIDFFINKGKRCYFRQVVFRGVGGVIREKTIRRLLAIKKGEIYSEEQVQRSLVNFYNSNLFYKISYLVIPDPLYPESLDVVFYFSVRKFRSLGLGFGYTFPPAGFIFSLENRYLNFLNRGQELRLVNELLPTINFKELVVNFNLNYNVPFWGQRKINFFFSPFLSYEKKEEPKLTIGEEVGFFHNLNKYWQVSFYHRLKKNYFLISEKIINSLIIKNIFDTRDNYFFSEKGIYLLPHLELAGGPLRGSYDFFRFSLEMRNFWQPFNFLVFGQRAFLGKMFPYGRTKIIPEEEKFFVGGRYSLRGYKEKEFSLTTVFYQNLESRLKVYKIFYFLLFFDWGWVDKKLPKSFGCGIRMATPIGPLRVDYGNKSEEFFKNWGKIYLGLGNVF